MEKQQTVNATEEPNSNLTDGKISPPEEIPPPDCTDGEDLSQQNTEDASDQYQHQDDV